MKKLLLSAAVCGIAALAASGASALTIIGQGGHTFMVHGFEDANNGWSSYDSDDYHYEPMNFNGGHCYDEPGNPEHCFLEVNNGSPTNLTYDDGAGDTNFDMLAFWFEFEGDAPNTLRLFDQSQVVLNPNPPNIALDPQTALATIALGGTYDLSVDPNLHFSIYSEEDTTTAFTGALQQQKGYWVVFEDDLFDDVTLFTWEAVENKQIRIDCVMLSSDGGNITNANLGSLGGECYNVNVPFDPTDIEIGSVPVPAALPMLGSVILGAGWVANRRRRKAA